jgi:hypothetical protein
LSEGNEVLIDPGRNMYTGVPRLKFGYIVNGLVPPETVRSELDYFTHFFPMGHFNEIVIPETNDVLVQKKKLKCSLPPTKKLTFCQ